MTPAPGAAPIRFGTSGWRGILAEDFTAERLRAVVHGVARWLREQGGGAVLVGHDTRFRADAMARLAAAGLAAAGLRPVPVRGPCPTPVVARAVPRRGATGALVLTASHNPPEYLGLKVFDATGASIDDAAARKIEGWIPTEAPESPSGGPAGRPVELCRGYVRDLVRCVGDGPRRRSVRVFYDAMHGAGAGVLDAALEDLGFRVTRLRPEPDPRFGGAAPDPAPERLTGLARAVRAGRGARLGLATDGDADRFAALDASGRAFSETEALALLVDQLARRGRIGRGVAISLATGSLVERVAASHGLPVSRHPIGFKHLSKALASGAADVAGEESGGFAWAGFGRDKDGLLAGCLLAARQAEAGEPLRAQLARLVRRHRAGRCGRIALPAGGPARERLAALTASPPRRIDASDVRAVADADGLHLRLDDGFVMLRVSGTEPVLRVYAEAPRASDLRRRLAAGAALLGFAGVSQGTG